MQSNWLTRLSLFRRQRHGNGIGRDAVGHYLSISNSSYGTPWMPTSLVAKMNAAMPNTVAAEQESAARLTIEHADELFK
ncbi:hypothetical protein CX648_16675 [Aeromonas dhakensis]|nr:hypothetical protein CX648_16675 [Aeromonas dhakensis]